MSLHHRSRDTVGRRPQAQSHPLLKKAGLRKVRSHDLRHTFASLLIQHDTPLLHVRKQMGYHSIEVTTDIYGHLAPGGNRAEVDRLDEPRDHTLEATIRNLSATTPTDSVLPERLSA
jgi:integrase